MTVLMRALNLSSNFITWTSTSPDYEGAYAPEAIQSGSAIVVADTGEATIENIGKLGLEYNPVGLWLFDWYHRKIQPDNVNPLPEESSRLQPFSPGHTRRLLPSPVRLRLR